MGTFKTQNEEPVKSQRLKDGQLETTIRGSGFTYDEKKKRTDESVPPENADTEDVVKLPNLGQLNRP